MSKPTQEEIDEYRDAFSLFDTEGDGKIDVEQIGSVLRSLNLNPADEDILKIEKDVGDRRVSFEEFLSIFLEEKKNAKKVSVEEFIDTLSAFDKDNAGKVSSGELRHVLTLLGNKLKDHQVDELLSDVGEQSGFVNTADFVNMVLSN
ncbi:PREDICTED: myosin-2 essential light chain-like [Acropora digitifera]|uniref:myosin-2 essential light chain-like n=1 Tax=Acropora digitifera TaxID=70779 RepID=UPI00077AEB85|nr:PREDICTED: myosin-2 essential light chain-like [Acropora digitifera]XP_029201351.1 myosin-2 essential light chain-like [Acropora millepora]